MLGPTLQGADRFVVVDTETTGIYLTDRLVEVAAVTMNFRGRIVDEWDTLINPLRDVGPTHIHGVSASMISAAPTFEEVAAALAERMHGAVIVAHNLSFDTRMLVGEFNNFGGVLSPGEGVCTLAASGERLPDACAHNGVSLHRHHRALADARATAQLLRCLADRHTKPISPAAIEIDESTRFHPRTLRREFLGDAEVELPYVARLADRVHHYGEHGPGLTYLDQLDYALGDLHFSDDEQAQLAFLATDVGLADSDVQRIHRVYLDELIAAASRDRMISDDESKLLHNVATALGIENKVVGQVISRWRPDQESGLRLEHGLRVCFTGAATYPDGTEIPRTRLRHIAEELGLTPVDSVTKKGTDLLVAADPVTQSGKAAKARCYEIPIASVDDLLHAHPGGSLPIAN